MEVSFEERLKALDEAKEKLIHNCFEEEQEKLEQELRQEYMKLKEHASKEGNNED